jgi:protein tyrosine/serine phosphatase
LIVSAAFDRDDAFRADAIDRRPVVMSDRVRAVRRWARVLSLLALLGLAAEQTWRHGHDYVFPSKFLVVDPGKVYRGAWQKSLPMKYILDHYHIKTIVALAHSPEETLPRQEQALAEGLGVRWVHIPIYYDSHDPLDSPEVGDRLERAAAIIADPANQPVFFHCHHGINRTSMTQIAYRTLYCGWSLDQAKEEIARMTGWKETSVGTGLDFMERFYEARVLPRRMAVAKAIHDEASTK